ncbi:MAG TPA: GMC family oxidoreductase [Capsulimonadaceae bacterium]|nr:GMC family oxidoreductase [Capsulimonadaceae bacterium]
MATNDYDAIVIGSGAAGGIVAAILSEAGKHVLLLERGQNLTVDQIPRDHVRNHRLSLYGHNTGPELDGFPRVWVDNQDHEHVVRPHEGAYQNNAMTVGGGTRVYGAQAWRFMPQDFRMATLYGVPEGSMLADWPISYDDLEPYYDRAEWEIGVSGDSTGNLYMGPRARGYPVDGNARVSCACSMGPRARGYPMPPVGDSVQHRVLAKGAKALGWSTFAAPLLINSIPYNGRPACIRCQHCVGHACPTDAKNGSHNTTVPRALATGNCELVTGALVERIDVNDRGNATGISYFVEQGGKVERYQATARAIVSSAGAIESARLLLNSSTPLHPYGLGNDFDLVGRNLQGHYYPGAYGLMPENVFDGLGPGPSIATSQFNHGNPGVIGGAMLADEFVKQPLLFWSWGLAPDVPRWGEENKRWMRENFTRVLQVQGPVQEIPNPEARVTIDPNVRDRYGVPVVRLSGKAHPETGKTVAFMRERAAEWVRASGATKIWTRPGDPVPLGLTGGQHQAGTCRMGADPKTSVTDPWGRVHGHDNLFVVDGSLHVTNGGFNPVLTIMALAFRSAEYIARNF